MEGKRRKEGPEMKGKTHFPFGWCGTVLLQYLSTHVFPHLLSTEHLWSTSASSQLSTHFVVQSEETEQLLSDFRNSKNMKSDKGKQRDQAHS
jgi:hypothetical protein